jgi:enoyl-CoA hydratase/carnithine racemase
MDPRKHTKSTKANMTNESREDAGSSFTVTEMIRNLVEYQVQDGIALLTLNDPPANTYSYEMMQVLDRAILMARMDENVQVLVITGAGEKFFCAGANINMLATAEPTFKYYFCLHANETLSRLEQTPKLVIAALNGHCVGGGLEVALAADIRLARRQAGKIGLPEVSLGVLPGTGGTQRLVRVVGKSKAIELMATGELLTFEVGHELGLIDRLYAADTSESFMEQVREYARQFTTPNKAANAVGRIKRSVQSGAELPLEYGLALERELQQQLFQSEDAREGIDAYVNKRKPHFKGK